MVRLISLCLISIVFAWSSQQVNASDDHELARQLLLQGKIVPAEVLVDKVWQYVSKGRLLELEFEKKGERYIYEVVVVDGEGQVSDFYFDAETGELIEREEKRGSTK